MALVERHPEHYARERHGSLESHDRAYPETITPASVAAQPQAPEPRFDFERWHKHPVAKLVLKAAGIAFLMLGLGGIGAFSMKKGLGAPKLALAESPKPAAPAGGWVAAQASLVSNVPSDNPAQPAAATPPESKPHSEGMTEDGRVILNRAGVEDLRHLPGVGQKRAEAILALRQKLGKFKRPADLLRVRGIGARRLKQLLPKLVVDAPVTPEPKPPGAPIAAPSSSAKAVASTIPASTPQPATSTTPTSSASR